MPTGLIVNDINKHIVAEREIGRDLPFCRFDRNCPGHGFPPNILRARHDREIDCGKNMEADSPVRFHQSTRVPAGHTTLA